jgi:thiol-disulfide isomerase/thioredoxin
VKLAAIGAVLLLLASCGKPEDVGQAPEQGITPGHELIAHDGAESGAWTMDFEAAKAKAAELNLPVLLDFTGSDWCGACKQMDAYVLQRQRFLAFAKDRLMLVTIDIPRDWSAIPEKYRARNEKMQEQYQIAKFPTLLLLDSNGSTVLGEARGIPEMGTFKSDLRGLIKYSRKAVDKRSAGMSEDEAARFRESTSAYLKAQQAFNAWINTRPTRTDENMVILENFKNQIATATQAAEDLEVEAFAKSLPAESATAYRELYAQRAAIMLELRANSDDQAKLVEINGRLRELVAKIAELRTAHFASKLDEATAADYLAAHSELRKIRQERNNFLAQDASLSEESRAALTRFDIAMDALRARIEVHE